MTLVPRLASWSTGLLAEIFGDEDGVGRPVAVILIDDKTLALAAARVGLDIQGNPRQAFLSSFPDRATMGRWFSGSEDPGQALGAFLMLCCFAASEAADLDANDYRKRLAELFDWTQRIEDCGALPSLWGRLQRQVQRSQTLRPFKLPDPDFRTIIGHAIELAFPSRPDATKLRTLLDSRVVDRDHPADVISLLQGPVISGRFTSSFSHAFKSFQAAWRAGQRALSDDRFWAGWRLITASETDEAETKFKIIADEYGVLRLVNGHHYPFDLASALRRHDLGRELEFHFEAGRPLFLTETEWGEWSWMGDTRTAKRSARAALICDRCYRGGRLEQFDRQSVAGAAGWSFTMALDVLLSSDERAQASDDQLFNPSLADFVRVDGGLLCRPSFPVRFNSELALGSVELNGIGAEYGHVAIDREGAVIAFKQPLTSNIIARLGVESTDEIVVRALRMRASAVAPKFSPVPSRLAPEQEFTLSGFEPTTSLDPSCSVHLAQPGTVTENGISDFIELLACRAGPIPMGDVLSRIGQILPRADVNKWDVLQSFYDAGILRQYRTLGWGGKSLMTSPPSAALASTATGWVAILEGVVNECLQERISGLAETEGLQVDLRPGWTRWSPPTLAIHGDSVTVLRRFLESFEIAVGFVETNPSALGSISSQRPSADGRNHTVRKLMPLSSTEIGSRGQLFLCERESNDAPRLWLARINGEDRYWTSRNDALIDIYLTTGVPAFQLTDNRLIASAHGCRLPTVLARWLRLITGLSSGPAMGEYFYPLTLEIEPVIRKALRRLLPTYEPQIPKLRLTRARSPNTGRTLAIRETGIPITIESWRWARHIRGK